MHEKGESMGKIRSDYDYSIVSVVSFQGKYYYYIRNKYIYIYIYMQTVQTFQSGGDMVMVTGTTNNSGCKILTFLQFFEFDK